MHDGSADSTQRNSCDNDTQTKLLDMWQTCFNSKQQNRRKRLRGARIVLCRKASVGKGTVPTERNSQGGPRGRFVTKHGVKADTLNRCGTKLGSHLDYVCD